MDDVAIEAVKSAVEGLWDKTPQSYMPVVLMAVLFIVVLMVISWMQHKHMERMYEKIWRLSGMHMRTLCVRNYRQFKILQRR